MGKHIVKDGLFFQKNGRLAITKESKGAVIKRARQEFPNMGAVTEENSSLLNVTGDTGKKRWFAGPGVQEALEEGCYFFLYHKWDGVLYVLHVNADFFAKHQKSLETRQEQIAQNGGFVRESFIFTLSAESHNRFKNTHKGSGVDFSVCKIGEIKVAAE